MQKTTNYGLNKPDTTDFYDVADQNANMDVIDEKLKEIDDGKLSLDGGTLSGALNLVQLRVNSASDQSYIQFMKNWSATGYIGVNGTDNPVFINADASKIFKLYGEHFKPTAEDVGALPITGGVVSGNIFAQSDTTDERVISVRNSLRKINFEVKQNGDFIIWDGTNVKTQMTLGIDGTNTFYGTASENLPLSGGAISGNLELVSSDATVKIFRLSNSKRTINFVIYADGRFCIEDPKNNVTMFSSDADGKTFVKPISGTYTGNGNKTVRTVTTNGLGNAVLIWNDTKDVMMMVSAGAFGKVGTTFKAISGETVSFRDGILTLITTEEALNADGVVYNYQVL